jgi:hypothetical protein
VRKPAARSNAPHGAGQRLRRAGLEAIYDPLCLKVQTYEQAQEGRDPTLYAVAIPSQTLGCILRMTGTLTRPLGVVIMNRFTTSLLRI